METKQGGCHCGAVRYEVTLDTEKPAIECNCSHCENKGMLLSFVKAEAFKLLSGFDALTEYRFNKKHISHQFCKHCGVQSFGKGQAPDGTDTVAVNHRTLDARNLDELKRTPFNGKDY